MVLFWGAVVISATHVERSYIVNRYRVQYRSGGDVQSTRVGTAAEHPALVGNRDIFCTSTTRGEWSEPRDRPVGMRADRLIFAGYNAAVSAWAITLCFP